MIEILMLYLLNKRERTIYGIRKAITDIFGFFTEPSIGTIYPALKKLEKEGAVKYTDRISEGGKKSSYYSIVKPKGLEFFKKLFLNEASDNPSLFFTHLQARLATMSLLDKEEKDRFVKDTLRRIDFFLFSLEKKLNDEFLELDYYQKKLYERTVNELNNMAKYVKELNLDEK